EAEEPIHKVDLANDVDEVEDLAEEEPDSVGLILEPMLDEVPSDDGDAFLLLVDVQHRFGELVDQALHPAMFPVPPDPSRKVEHCSLHEQKQRHPLIVSVLNDSIAFLDLPLVNARSCDIDPQGAVECSWQRDCALHPAVAVHD